MIGKIVVGLLAVVCFSGMLTEAQVNLCEFYKPKASFSDITGFAYAVEYSVNPFPCLTLNIELASTFSIVGKNFSVTNTYNDAGRLVSQTFYLLESSLIPGRGETYLANIDGDLELAHDTVIVGYVADGSGFKGYAVASCNAVNGSIRVAILLKSLPPDSAVVSELKAQLPNDLQFTFLHVIPHNSSCVYPQH